IKWFRCSKCAYCDEAPFCKTFPHCSKCKPCSRYPDCYLREVLRKNKDTATLKSEIISDKTSIEIPVIDRKGATALEITPPSATLTPAVLQGLKGPTGPPGPPGPTGPACGIDHSVSSLDAL